MNVLFINPPWFKNSNNKWSKISSCMPPFGLALIGSILEEKQIKVTILDCNAQRIGLDDVHTYLPKVSPDYVGITATTPLIYNAYDIARIVKKRFPRTTVVLGGVHSTILPDESLRIPEVDLVVRGEGELSFLELIEKEEAGLVDNISYKQGDEIVHNEVGPMADINAFPPPAYHLLPMKNYFSALGSYRKKPAMGMVTTRGCPGKCTFCNPDIFGKKIRFVSAQKIFEEVCLLQKDYGIREISFYDDNFTTFKKNVHQFCELLIKNNMRMSWSCFSRVDTVDKNTLELMKASGCHQVMYGVESASKEILDAINKRINLDKVYKAVRLTQEAGIDVRAAFMLGSPGETEKTIIETIDYAVTLEPDIVIFNITTPYPGTAMFDWADDNHYLLTKNWADYDLSRPVMELPTLPTDILNSYYKTAYRRFYLRLNYIIRRLFKIRNFSDVKINFDALCAVIR